MEKLEKEILKIFTEEFYTCISNILTISKEEFFKYFIHRMNIILKAYHSHLLNEIRKNKSLFINQIKRIANLYYNPIKELCEKIKKYKVFRKINNISKTL